MSYAIIRNANYKRDNLAGLYKHNEKKKIQTILTRILIKIILSIIIQLNNAIQLIQKHIKQLINENDLKCRITSYTNLVCELIITSDKEFFEKNRRK